MNHEVKCLTRCLKAGIVVPAVKGVDVHNGIILMDWIEGHGSVREVLGGLPEEGDANEDEEDDEEDREEEQVPERLKRLGLDEGESELRPVKTPFSLSLSHALRYRCGLTSRSVLVSPHCLQT